MHAFNLEVHLAWRLFRFCARNIQIVLDYFFTIKIFAVDNFLQYSSILIT